MASCKVHIVRSTRTTTMKSVIGAFIMVLASTGGFKSANAQASGLSADYYDLSCPAAKGIILANAVDAVFDNPDLAASLLRMNFHDCFVHGCDASVLIYKSDHTAERDGFPNVNSLRGFEFIDTVKAEIEAVCSGIVSCADIIALSALYSVSILDVYQGPYFNTYWNVTLGRKDRNISNAVDADNFLPAPFFNFAQLLSSFEAVGLNLTDLVALSAAHTIGLANCTVFDTSRLYDYNGVPGAQDPSLNITFAKSLKVQCPSGVPQTRVPMKQMTGYSGSTNNTFDNHYFTNLLQNEGLFISDQALTNNTDALKLVKTYAADQTKFLADFVTSMQKMIVLNVTTTGHVRRNCSDPLS